LINLLEKHQVQVEYPMEQTCCGLPAMMATEEETAKDVAIQNIKAMGDFDYIITLCASCGSHLKENYPKLLPRTAELKAFTDKVIDFSSFMMNVLNVSADEFQKHPEKVAYHSPCHLCRGLKVVDEPRKLISIAGYEYLPSTDEDVCCGFGGSYSVDFPEISKEILAKKLENVEKTGADILVTDCPGCVMQLKGGVDKRGGKIAVKHIAEILSRD